MRELDLMKEARTLLRVLTAETPTAPWIAQGREVVTENGVPVLAAHVQQVYEGVAVVELVTTLRGTADAMLWVLHCGIEAAGRPESTNPRTQAAAQVALGVTIASALLGREYPATIETRRRLMDAR